MTLKADIPKAVLFDLDGTLVDTAPDLARATNALRKEHGLAPLAYDEIRREVSHGGSALVTLALGLEKNASGHNEARTMLLEYYGKNVAEESCLFEGFSEVLDRYRSTQRPWGVITNKPREYAVSLLEALNIAPDVLLCADDLPVKKPDPAPLLEAARRLDIAPQHCWYIGDHLRDIQAANNAGMTAIAVKYGYLRQEDDPDSWPASQFFETPAALCKVLLQHDLHDTASF
ncbi:HAD-IA family hydrolase [Kushneria indalinina]|uniref:Phosphoglycolate phosphatase n=1 Tax=Kushneria indalinina DSM 14324 TaxID=1122140 RepID=A0A3D9DZQ2_9GAMM|nr:HAD-IA family hydrolase [Kushneria indalinina]REC96238.1 phosphoglycolate phosphatase [Kushneria indalinina DSM 14324]